MNIELKHPFVVLCDPLTEILAGVETLSQFCKNLEEHSKTADRPEKFVGDGFELFVEALIKLNEGNKLIGIGGYKPGPEVEAALGIKDMGIDGYGKGVNGKNATVQAKYLYLRNRRFMLVANTDGDKKRITNFTTQSWGTTISDLQVDQNDTTNLILISTAADLHPVTKKEMFNDKVYFVGWKQISKMVDNNSYFWDAFRNLCTEQRDF